MSFCRSLESLKKIMGEEVVKVELREKKPRRPRSASYIAVRAALYQLTSFADFSTQKIGAGFYADVFKVQHKSTGEVMVLKMNKSRKNSKQMLGEIQLMNRLSHPNILGFKGSCVHEGQLHALTEYINGGSLEDLLHNRHLELSWSMRVKVARDIARGMAYLHSKGVFHRDLTSKNCLVQREPNGEIRTVVADFGLAAKIKHSHRRSYTEVVGSPYWMAPECLNGKVYCEQADVFSYGIILAEIMARIPADPDFMPRTKWFGMDFDVLKKMCANCPEEMWQLMCQCCQLDPDDRPTFEEAVQILDRIEIEADPDQDIRSCYSEPVLRLLDSDEDTSSSGTPGGSNHILEGSFNGLGSVTGSSSSIEEREDPKISKDIDRTDHGFSVTKENELLDGDRRKGRSSRDLEVTKERVKSSSSENLLNGLNEFHSEDRNGSQKTLVSDSTEEELGRSGGKNKGGGDSGIDPGEMFRCSTTSESSSLCNINMTGEKNPADTGRSRTDTISSPKRTRPLAHAEYTPLYAGPSLHGNKRPRNVLIVNSALQMESRTPGPLSRASSDDVPRHLVFVTPSGQCTSPLAQSLASSDFSFNLPSPSTPWAPPCSPNSAIRPSHSHSLPSSPVSFRRFRFSQEMPSNFQVTGPSLILANKRHNRKSTPILSAYDDTRNSAHFEQFGAYSIAEGDFETDSEADKSAHFWKRDSLCTNLDEEHFSRMMDSPSQLQRTRSRSNPAFVVRKQSAANYSLTLARCSPDSSASSYKCYNIRLRKNYRLSSSEPNLTLLYGAVR